MKIKVSTILMIMTMSVMVATLGVTRASAADGPPLECTDGKFTVMPIASAVGEFPRAAEEGECNGLGGWVWEYIVTAGDKELQALTKLHVYIPSLPPNIIEVFDAEHIADRGEGGVSTPFGKGNYNGIVLSLTPVAGASSNYVEFSFCTDVNTTGTVSVLFDTAKFETGCATGEVDSQGPIGGIIGPGFGPSQFAALETDKRIQLGDSGGVVCAKKHPRTGCIKYFYNCSDTNQNPEPLPSQTDSPIFIDGQIVDMGDLEDPLCREAIFARKGSPVVYWGYANGKYYCIGVYDPAIPSWTPAPCP